MPDVALNSAFDGEWPSFRAAWRIASRTAFLSIGGMGVVFSDSNKSPSSISRKGWLDGFYIRPDQGMEGFGPQNLPHSLAASLGLPCGERDDEWPTITVGIKPPGSAVSAGSDKMQVGQPVIMRLARHAEIEAQGPAHMAQYATHAPPAASTLSQDHPSIPRLAQRAKSAGFVHIARARWRIEQDYRELEEELGLDQYEGRRWLGWHHHVCLASMAYAFLRSEQARLKKTSHATWTLPQVRRTL
jgi:hypothetical protein